MLYVKVNLHGQKKIVELMMSKVKGKLKCCFDSSLGPKHLAFMYVVSI